MSKASYLDHLQDYVTSNLGEDFTVSVGGGSGQVMVYAYFTKDGRHASAAAHLEGVDFRRTVPSLATCLQVSYNLRDGFEAGTRDRRYIEASRRLYRAAVAALAPMEAAA